MIFYTRPQGLSVIRRTATKAVMGSPGMRGIMQFDCVISTSRVDRDGDTLITSGAEPDPKMPLLWQHNAQTPVGKLLTITSHTKDELCGRFAIADTEFGRAAAKLIDFGALRISHGFQPIEYEPKTNGGWLIKRFTIMEASLVSVPSNVDAEITSVMDLMDNPTTA